MPIRIGMTDHGVNMKRYHHFILTLLLGSLAFAAWAEENADDSPAAATEEVKDIQYVTDKLRLSLYRDASASSGTLKLLVSGDRLEVLERKGPYSRVRTANGQIGWVKNGFLITEPTAVTQLAQAQKRIAELEGELEKYADSRGTLQRYEQRIAELEQNKAELEQQLEQAQSRIAELEQQLEGLQAELERSRNGDLGWNEIWSLARLYWWMLAAISLLLALIGFLAGKLWIEKRIRNRFHGYKVW